MKNKLIISLILLTLTACSQPKSLEEVKKQTTNTTNPQQQTQELPNQLILDVPFISQAPHANWDDPYQEACEEASMIMVHNYQQGINQITPDQADQQILELVDFETSLGLPYDINTQEMQSVIQKFYQKESTILDSKDINIQNFKKLLNNGQPIIIPAQGQLLENPNFSNGGPEYHMLVIIGYNDKKQEFITNDPGTRKGQQYKYPYQTIINSIHDWTGNKETVINGPKKAIIFN